MVAGVVALAITLAFNSGGTPAGSSDPGSRGGRLDVSVFGTIHPHIGQYRAPVGSQVPRVRLASLATDFAADNFAANEGQTTAAMAATDRASFDERYNSSFGERFSPFDERFAAPTEGEPELTPRSAPRPRTVPVAELGRDSPARPETPKRQNARLAMLAPPASAAAATRALAGTAPNKPMRRADARSDAMLSDPGGRTAIYDISARVVYLPNGERLEAHSGFGSHMDDPRSVGVKNRGVTPPNVYELSLRERLFHGVRAIRLTPVDPDRMFGREGILAHSYLLGPSGQSNGCVSISDYPKFLSAFLNGEVDRLVVVERLAEAPPPRTGAAWLAERLKAFFRSS